MLQSLPLILIKPQPLLDKRISLRHLRRGKARGDPRRLRVILNQMHDPVKAPVNGPAVFICIAEILSSGAFLIFGHMERMVNQLADSLILGCGNRNHRNPQHVLQLIYPDLIHHIQGQHHGNVHLH